MSKQDVQRVLGLLLVFRLLQPVNDLDTLADIQLEY